MNIQKRWKHGDILFLSCCLLLFFLYIWFFLVLSKNFKYIFWNHFLRKIIFFQMGLFLVQFYQISGSKLPNYKPYNTFHSTEFRHSMDHNQHNLSLAIATTVKLRRTINNVLRVKITNNTRENISSNFLYRLIRFDTCILSSFAWSSSHLLVRIEIAEPLIFLDNKSDYILDRCNNRIIIRYIKHDL